MNGFLFLLSLFYWLFFGQGWISFAVMVILGIGWLGAKQQKRNASKPQTDLGPDLLDAPEPMEPELVDINTADYSQLLGLPGIGAAEAKLILVHVQRNGPIRSFDELATVLSLKPRAAARLRPRIQELGGAGGVPADQPQPASPEVSEISVPKPSQPNGWRVVD